MSIEYSENMVTFMFRNIDKLHKLQAPHYDVPAREHHFAGIKCHHSIRFC